MTENDLAARAARIGRQHGRKGANVAPAHEPAERPADIPATIPPRARSTDPVTAHMAAAGLAGVSDKQAAVLEVLRHLGPLTDEELAYWYELRVVHNGYPQQSPSGLRTRRRELTDAGLVNNTGTTRETKSGAAAIVWAAP